MPADSEYFVHEAPEILELKTKKGFLFQFQNF